MDQPAHRILTTTDYKLFSWRKANRDIKEAKVTELMPKIDKSGQLIPAMVDVNMRIIDGQHRFEACRRLKKPFKYFIETARISMEQVSEINSINTKWTPLDHAKSYATQGKEDYKQYMQFEKEFSDFSHGCRLILLKGINARSVNLERDFNEGSFTINSMNKARQQANFLKSLAQFYPGYKRRSFVLAVLHLMENPLFDKERFMRKMPKRCKDILDFSQTSDYISTLQDIYNWKETKKVSFTY
jgi:hypothetical protein